MLVAWAGTRTTLVAWAGTRRVVAWAGTRSNAQPARLCRVAPLAGKHARMHAASMQTLEPSMETLERGRLPLGMAGIWPVAAAWSWGVLRACKHRVCDPVCACVAEAEAAGGGPDKSGRMPCCPTRPGLPAPALRRHAAGKRKLGRGARRGECSRVLFAPGCSARGAQHCSASPASAGLPRPSPSGLLPIHLVPLCRARLVNRRVAC